jgi:hypothetical protein
MVRVAVVLLSLCALLSPAWAQTPNTWTEHSNTAFSAWAVSSGVQAEHDSCNPSSGVGAILGAWVSGAYHDGLKKYLAYRQGGHADGCWNGGAAFDPATKTWSRLTTASPNATKMTSANPDDTNFLVKYADGTPASVHSYGTQFCITSGALNGKCVTSGGIYWSRAGKSSPETPFLYDPSQPTAATAYTEKKLRPGGYGTVMAWNATRQRAFLAGSAGAYEWEPVADVYTQLFTTTGPGTGTTVALDEAAGRVYLLFGGGTAGTRLKVVDYATAATTKYQTITTTGGAGLEDLAAPGFVFAGRDATNRARLVGLGKASVTIPNPAGGTVTGDRAAIFVLLDDNVCGRGTAAPCAWTRITPTNATSNLPPKPFTNGMWNKFFAHGCDLFAIVASDKQSAAQLPPSGDLGNVWSFRPDFALPSCGGPPPPQQFPVTVTAGPGGTASGPTGLVTVGAPVTLTTTPNAGQQFTGWTGDAVCANTFAMPAQAVACQANFAPILVTLTVNTVGQVIASGAGSYPVGSVATLALTSVAPGWGNVTVSGDPGCALGPITMDSNKTCLVLATDVQAPQVLITAPTNGDIFTQAVVVPIGVQATDNVGVTEVVCTVNDAPVPCAGWDLAGLPKGHYTLGARAKDAAGNVGSSSITVTVVLCPVCPPPTALYPLDTEKTGTGDGVVGGDGLYKENAPVTLMASPDDDSTEGTWSPAPCSSAPFPMPKAALTCTKTFTKKSYALTVAAAGQGTVAGGGQFTAGALVVLTATPAAGWTFAGWGPAPCAPQFAMPANALACTATFTQQASGPVSNLADRTWRNFPLSVLGQSKHARIIFDSTRGRMVVAGGDGTDGSGNSFTGQMVHAIDLAVSATWQRLHGFCPAQGGVIPPGADDSTWVYDAKRDQGFIAPAYYGGITTKCAPMVPLKPAEPALYTPPSGPPQLAKPAAGTPAYADYLASPEYQAYLASPEYKTYLAAATKRAYVFNFASNTWAIWNGPTPPSSPPGATTPTFGWGGDLHNHFGVLDPTTDKVYRGTYLCNTGGMQIIPLDGAPGECLPFSFPNAPAGSWDVGNDQSAIDVQGRHIYIIARWKRVLLKWSIDQKKVVELIPMPATWVRPTSEFGGGDYETHIAFDSKNRVLMIPNDVSYGGATTGTLIDATTGQNRGVYFFNVDTKAWEWEPAPTDKAVSGNILGYDPKNNVFVYVGRSAAGKPVEYWTYRYKN